MRLAIIGAGHVGGTLAKGWASNGHQIVLGLRRPDDEKYRPLLEQLGGGAKAASIADAAAEGQVVVLCVPWPAAEQTLVACGEMAGKIVIDTMNPIAGNYDGLTIGTITSAGEQVAEWLPKAKVVKTLNHAGFKIMADPMVDGQHATMFLASDHADAKHAAAHLVEQLGFAPCDAGPLKVSRYLEPLALLWIQLARKQGLGLDIAFKLMQR